MPPAGGEGAATPPNRGGGSGSPTTETSKDASKAPRPSTPPRHGLYGILLASSY